MDKSVNFVKLDEAGDDQWQYINITSLLVQKNNHF